MRTLRFLLLGGVSLGFIVVSGGCGSSLAVSSDATTGTEQDALADIAVLAEIVDVAAVDASVVPDLVEAAADLSGGVDAHKADAGCSEAGCPCSENLQCDSGYCIESPTGQQCAKICTDNCADGFKCAQITGTTGDISNLCVPAHPRLCEPCAADSDCNNVLGGANSRCLVYKDLAGATVGNFCGNKCSVNSDCATGYSCKDVTSVGGQKGGQCIKDDMLCNCDVRATQLQSSTSCSVVNAAGSCGGKRSCGVNGLSACDAPSATPEQCNKKDDNCDGQTDESGPGMCDDGEACSYDNCVGGECQHPPKPGGCDDKSACTSGDECNNGKCVGKGVVCDDKNPCTLDNCDLQKGCASAADPAAKCSDDNLCTVSDSCKDGLCLPGAATVCDDSNPCTTDSCDSKLGCVFSDNNLACSDGDVCTLGDTCKGGGCSSSGKLPCNDGNPCSDDSCDAGKGCIFVNNALVCDDNNNCTTGDTCKDGVCTPSAPSNCDDGNPCTTETCDPKGGCKSANNTASCSDDSLCTVNDTCEGGKCVPGKALVCNDGNGCSDDSCDGKLGCQFSNNSAACSDSNLCTEGDVCAGGICQPGVGKNCDDTNLCTSDSCDAKKGCVNSNNSVPCSDDSVCTFGDACDGGKCVGGKLLVCNDGNVCTDDSCDGKIGCQFNNNSAPCSDNNVCTESDSCVGGGCQVGAFKVCDDNNPCTSDSCDSKKGCVSVNNNLACNDKNICTENDTCKDGSCEGGAPKVCNDGNVCTTDICDAIKGCVTFNNGEVCTDNNVCTVGDSCVGGACLPGAGKICDDGKPCTTDSCDAKTGCSTSNNSLPCDDGDACSSGDTCVGGNCGAGKGINCDDGNPCTDDSCDKANGCVHAKNTAGCSDGNVCTLNDICGGGVCLPGAAKNCDDGNACTDDACSPSTGCGAVNNKGACSDGNVCTGGDQCSDGSCVAGSKIPCNDGNVCTDDSCNAVTGCVFANNSAVCSDGNGCTSGDVCGGGVCKGGIGCSANGQCVAGAQAVKCVCQAGYSGDGFTCNDVDECVAGIYSCPVNEVCVNTVGSYTCACKANYGDCNNNPGDGCEANFANDVNNCNGCASVCGTANGTPGCSNNQCSIACTPGYTDCDGKNVNGCEVKTLGTDINNCGGCATACSTSHVSASCANGVCNGGCAAGYSDCNSNKQSDGCEVQTLGNDVNNCGGCTVKCSTSNIAQTCTGGSCNGACAAGYSDCNSNKQSDGCEVQTGGNNINNCGGCGTVCSNSHIASPTCGAGVCNAACDAGFGDCNGNKQSDGCETAITNNDANCGGCGIVCGGGTSCVNTTCTSVLPSQCSAYSTLSNNTRNVGYVAGTVLCDTSLGSGSWYRFTGAAGTQMPTSAPGTYHCGTHAPGWLNSAHPNVVGQTVGGTVCFQWSGGPCTWSQGIQITNCNGFYVYQLNNINWGCNGVYCGQ